jgi:hypothetical protein
MRLRGKKALVMLRKEKWGRFEEVVTPSPCFAVGNYLDGERYGYLLLL